MQGHQFGRIENIPVRGGQPIISDDLRVVRVARFGGKAEAVQVADLDQFELKGQVRELFEELERISEGTVIRLEFRHGLPFSVEITSSVRPSEQPPL